ncbi:MAG: hypothetical protein Q8O76_13700, partial [Chloroflexota bacterium]|nr:hypothetical protein [Chloroflexota bacterium]
MKAAQDRRMYALAGVEGILAILALVIAFLLRLPFPQAFDSLALYWWALPLSALVLWYSFWAAGLYRWVWYHLGMKEVIHLAWGINLSSLALAVLLLVITGFPLPKSILVLNWLIALVFLGGTRFTIRLRRELLQAKGPSPVGQKRQRALLVGAGEAAEAILREMGRRAPWDLEIIGCLDDDSHKVGHSIHGLPVLGTIQELPSLARRHEVKEAIIAIPSASGEAMRRIVSLCEEARLRFRTLPSLTELVEGKVGINRLREVNIEDLMGRQP